MLRYVAVLIILAAAATAGFFGLLQDWCEDKIAEVGSAAVATTCRPPQITDLPFVLLILVVLALALPDFRRVAFAGVELERKIEAEGSETRDVMRAVAARIETSLTLSQSAQASAVAYADTPRRRESLREQLAAMGIGVPEDGRALDGEDLRRYASALMAAEGVLRQLDSVRAVHLSRVEAARSPEEIDALFGAFDDTDVTIAGRSLAAIDALTALQAISGSEAGLRALVEDCWNLGQLTTSTGEDLDPSLIRAVTQELVDNVGSIRAVVGEWSRGAPEAPVSELHAESPQG